MEGYPLQTVTLEVLVKSELRTCDGWMALPNGRPSPEVIEGTSSLPVRVVKDSEIVQNGDLHPELRKRLSVREWDLLCAMHFMGIAEERFDSGEAKKAYRLMVGSGKEEYAHKLLFSAYTYKNIGSDLDVLISLALAKAHLVCWAKWRLKTAEEDAKTPRRQRRAVGIYCPDYKTAIAAKLILGHVRICIHCRRPFIPTSTSTDQKYCGDSCGAAHRTARSRAHKLKRDRK